jgi:hypothetical protein
MPIFSLHPPVSHLCGSPPVETRTHKYTLSRYFYNYNSSLHWQYFLPIPSKESGIPFPERRLLFPHPQAQAALPAAFLAD